MSSKSKAPACDAPAAAAAKKKGGDWSALVRPILPALDSFRGALAANVVVLGPTGNASVESPSGSRERAGLVWVWTGARRNSCPWCFGGRRRTRTGMMEGG